MTHTEKNNIGKPALFAFGGRLFRGRIAGCMEVVREDHHVDSSYLIRPNEPDAFTGGELTRKCEDVYVMDFDFPTLITKDVGKFIIAAFPEIFPELAVAEERGAA